MYKVNDRAVCGWLFAMGMSLLFWCWVIAGLTGCGSSNGWRVSFGVAPVASIDDRQTLTDKRK